MLDVKFSHRCTCCQNGGLNKSFIGNGDNLRYFFEFLLNPYLIAVCSVENLFVTIDYMLFFDQFLICLWNHFSCDDNFVFHGVMVIKPLNQLNIFEVLIQGLEFSDSVDFIKLGIVVCVDKASLLYLKKWLISSLQRDLWSNHYQVQCFLKRSPRRNAQCSLHTFPWA